MGTILLCICGFIFGLIIGQVIEYWKASELDQRLMESDSMVYRKLGDFKKKSSELKRALAKFAMFQKMDNLERSIREYQKEIEK